MSYNLFYIGIILMGILIVYLGWKNFILPIQGNQRKAAYFYLAGMIFVAILNPILRDEWLWYEKNITHLHFGVILISIYGCGFYFQFKKEKISFWRRK